MPLGWRRGTRAVVIGVTLLVIVVAAVASRAGIGAGSSHPTATPTSVPAPPLACRTVTVSGSRYVVCPGGTPVPK